VVVFDGATVRAGLSHELEYTPSDRAEHLRRVAHMCNLLNNQGIITICAFISPKESIREQIKEIIGKNRFTLLHTHEPLDVCKQNQPELYEKYEKGLIENVPGLDVIYEKPEDTILVKSENQIEDLTKKL